MQLINDRNVEFKNKVSGSKYLYVDEKMYAFGTAYLRPGDEIKEHVHADETELFYFISGTPEFTCAGKKFRVGPGDSIKSPAGEAHALKNDTNETVHLNFIKIKVAG